MRACVYLCVRKSFENGANSLLDKMEKSRTFPQTSIFVLGSGDDDDETLFLLLFLSRGRVVSSEKREEVVFFFFEF